MHFPYTAHFSYAKSGIGILLGSILCLSVSNVWAVQQRTTISLTLSNTYSGELSLVSPLCILSGIQYINYTGTIVQLTASAPVTYTLSGTMTVASTGNITSWWITQTSVDFLTGQTGHMLRAQLMRNTEWFNTTPRMLTIDETPPSWPLTIQRPRTLRNDTVWFVWSGVTDELPVSYRLVIAPDPSFSTVLSYDTTGTTLLLDEEDIREDEHIIFWYLEVLDCVGNELASTPGFFYYNLDTVGWTRPVKPKKEPEEETNDTIYEEEPEQPPVPEEPTEELPPPEPPLEEVLPEEPLIEEDLFEEIPLEETPWEHLAAPWRSDRLPFANDQPPVYASKLLTPAQRQAAKLKEKLKNAPYPLDFFPQLAILPLAGEIPEHSAAYDPYNTLILLIRQLPPRFSTTALYEALEYLVHIRYLGLILIFGILGYDVERIRYRLLYCDKILFYMIKIWHFRKKHI